jgi:hypothetical protein
MHASGGIAGGGWHGGVPGGIGHLPGVGGEHLGAIGHGIGGPLPGAIHGGFPATLPGHGPAWPGGIHGAGLAGGFPGYGPGWHGGVPGAGGYGGYAHPYSWYNGHWHNHWYGNGFGGYGFGGYGFGGYGGGWRYPLAWGLGGWGLGSLWYSSGYMPYYNPYYSPVGGVGGGWNYGQPIPVPAGPALAGGMGLAGGPNGIAANAVDPNAIEDGGVDPNAMAANLAPDGNPDIDAAVERFRAGDYAGALPLVDGAIQAQPADAAAHELRALILFAMEDYSQAAATIHSVLAIGPGWDWTTLSSLYPNMQTYMAQLRALERFVSGHPGQADARFLLAYHYMTQSHSGEAASQLEKVVKLMPTDKLAADLLRMAQGGNAAAPPPAANPPAPGPDVKPVDPALLAGSWQSSRDDGSKFSLNLAADKSFTWKFSQQQQEAQTISGTYTIDNGLLIMQGKTGGAMVGQVSAAGGDRFTFKPVGAPPDDPGLTFTR